MLNLTLPSILPMVIIRSVGPVLKFSLLWPGSLFSAPLFGSRMDTFEINTIHVPSLVSCVHGHHLQNRFSLAMFYKVFLALVLVWNMGVVSTSDALSGFNNPGVLAVGSLFVVIKGVEKSRLADKAAQHVFGMQTSYTTGLLRLMGLTFILSAFLNNTPVVALLIPTTCDWARTRGFSAAQLLMPLSFSCIFGGLLTIIGTSTNLVVQGLVIEAGMSDSSVKGLGFFEPGYIGLPLGLVGMTYLVFAAPRILPSTRDSTLSGRGQDNCDLEEYLTEVTDEQRHQVNEKCELSSYLRYAIFYLPDIPLVYRSGSC